MNAADALEAIRDEEDADSVAILIDDDDLLKLVSVWSRIPNGFNPGLDIGDAPKWEDLWRASAVDVGLLAVAIGLPEEVSTHALHRAIIARTVYPDGTVNRFVKGYVRARIKAAMTGKGPRPLQKGPPPRE